ncbi:unnamed protein product [Fraxinus pennsylvanica]|uniref:Uncharacterized protein n=1 Tax=Fraxinus pennsylvanica TaxID=56036 RepID=A0AAD2DXM0_9LAMI|nr:unnamed protein product [Fraxinus pennsylvanica]
MVDQEFFTLAEEALKILTEKSQGNFTSPIFIVIEDENCDPQTLQYALGKGAIGYESSSKLATLTLLGNHRRTSGTALPSVILREQRLVRRVWCFTIEGRTSCALSNG